VSEKDYSEFCQTVASQISASAPKADVCIDHLRQSLTWTVMSLNTENHEDCMLLLNGCYGAALEAVTLLSFGLVRPAILSLRSHYELSLMFLYYKDHPVEWRNTKLYRARPKLPGDIKKYLRENYASFEGRWGSLCKVKEREIDDCYDVLSGVAHGAALNSISSATKPKELIESQETIQQSVSIFMAVGESINDIYVACFEGSWISLPDDAKSELVKRFGTKNPVQELCL